MNIRHTWEKFKPYLSSGFNYWRSADKEKYVIQDSLGPFFGMRLQDRLEDGHYDLFDEEGLPVRLHNKETYRSWSTIFSYSFARYEQYLQTGNKDHLIPMRNTFKHIVESGVRTDYNGLVFPHHNILSAMNQGEALSVIARLYEVDKDEKLLEVVPAILHPYSVNVKDGGVRGQFLNHPKISWFEELAELPGKHILNGMNYSLLGLYEIHKATNQFPKAEELFNEGITNLKKALPLFDNGYWSNYWFDDVAPHYIASVMYHNLHIRQLEYFAAVLNDDVLSRYRDLFIRYQQNPVNRIKAGITIFKSKIG
ncbi:MAG: hypothetical protein GC181_03665 [Bacteroidetes bacterium]|nr:hypothetical protein [Bacteroidota bacterium]